MGYLLKKAVFMVAKLGYALVVKWLKDRAKYVSWFVAGTALLLFLTFAVTVWWPLLVGGLFMTAIWGAMLMTLQVLEQRGY